VLKHVGSSVRSRTRASGPRYQFVMNCVCGQPGLAAGMNGSSLATVFETVCTSLLSFRGDNHGLSFRGDNLSPHPIVGPDSRGNPITFVFEIAEFSYHLLSFRGDNLSPLPIVGPIAESLP